MTYDTKTVRVHLPDRGMYVYFMITRFDGEDHMLYEMGYGGVYYHFATMSQNSVAMHSDTDPFKLARKHSESGWLKETVAFDFIFDLDTGKISWDEIEDEQQLTPEDIEALREVEE